MFFYSTCVCVCVCNIFLNLHDRFFWPLGGSANMWAQQNNQPHFKLTLLPHTHTAVILQHYHPFGVVFLGWWMQVQHSFSGFWPLPTPEGNTVSGSEAAKCSTMFCLSCGAQQVEYSGVSEHFLVETADYWGQNDAMRALRLKLSGHLTIVFTLFDWLLFLKNIDSGCLMYLWQKHFSSLQFKQIIFAITTLHNAYSMKKPRTCIGHSPCRVNTLQT